MEANLRENNLKTILIIYKTGLKTWKNCGKWNILMKVGDSYNILTTVTQRNSTALEKNIVDVKFILLNKLEAARN